MDKEFILDKLEKINWDTPMSTEYLYKVFTGEIKDDGSLDKKWIYRKLLNGFNWYTVIKIVPKEEWEDLLADDIINSLFPRSRRSKYKNVREILFGEALSVAG